MSKYVIIIFIALCLVMSYIKKINAYDEFVDGVKEALSLFINIFPNLLAIMFCIKLLESSQIFYYISEFLRFLNTKIPPEIIPMILFRPISGNASLGVLINIFEKQGPDSLAGIMASVMQGATDTTFYVYALYFGVAKVNKASYTLFLCLFADFCAIMLTIYLVLIIYG